MYSLIENLLNVPSQYANSTVTAVAGTITILFVVIMVDMFIRLIKSFTTYKY